MRPEDIDRLFKERLGNTTPTPPADLWSRLQDRMEAEAPQKLQVQSKEERRSHTWLYSSIAATVSLVLTVGVVFFNIKTGTPEISETIADKGRIELSETPAPTQPAPETIAKADAQPENSNAEKNNNLQATDPNPAASSSSEEVVKIKGIAKAGQRKPAKAIYNRQPQATGQQAIADNTQTNRAAEAAEIASVPAVKPVTPTASFAATTADMNAEPVEIIIKRAVASQTAMAEADVPGDANKKAKLAKNIFKQVRNLAAGDGVELSELGINAESVALETRIGKQKFSKVINL